MSDHGSTYSVLQSAPVMISPLYNLPKKILISGELNGVSDNVARRHAYPFALERQVIAKIEATRKRLYEEEEAFKQKKQNYEQELIQKQKVAARKIAPGFLDTDTRILQPQQTYKNNTSEDEINTESTSPKNIIVNSPKEIIPVQQETSQEKQFKYLDFEQGLAPADPWDTPENDMAALRSILGSPKLNYEPKQTPTPPQYQSPQYTQPYQSPVYWNKSNPVYSSPPFASRQPSINNSLPAVPPKLFNQSPLPTSSTSSPILSPPTLPPPSNYHKVSGISKAPPPIPPLPNFQPALPNEDLINELGNMGFTRLQAIDALEKNDHDLIRATNFLLDQD